MAAMILSVQGTELEGAINADALERASDDRRLND